MKYVLLVITALYASLSLIAAFTQLKSAEKKDTSWMMLLGSVLLITSSVFLMLGLTFDWTVAVIGGTLISVAAFVNGKRGGNFHASHHVVRFLITVLLVVGIILW